jgi:hypothetical protein
MKIKHITENMDHSQDDQAVPELKSALEKRKAELQSASDDQVYDKIDQLMTRIAKSHGMSGQKLHDMWVEKYGEVPDTWIMEAYELSRLKPGVVENTAAGINKMFNNLGDPVYANLQRVALLAMQGRQSEAAGRLQTVIKSASPDVQKKITDAVNNIKPVTINGRVADSSTLDKSKQHNDWIINTFIPWVQSLLGQQGVAENFHDGRHPEDKGDSVRHGIPKKATMAELEKASHAKGRKGQLARWQLNMRRGHKK